MANTPFINTSVAAQLQQLSPYMQAAFNAKLDSYEAGFHGGLDIEAPDPEVKPDYGAENPRFAFQGTVVRKAASATPGDSAAGPTSKHGRGPSRTFAPTAALEFQHLATYGYKKSEVELVAELAGNFGKGAARYCKQSVYHALTGAIAAQSTGGQHLYDLTGLTVKTVTLSRIIYAKALMGDAGANAVAFCCHSAVERSLAQDIVSGSNSGGLIRVWIENEESVKKGIEAIGGMRLCVDDDLPIVLPTTTTSNYRSFILSPGAAWIKPAIKSPLLTVTPDLIESNVRSKRVTIEGVFALGVPGMDFDFGTKANPTDAELYAATYWAEAFSFDHRDVKACEVYSQMG